jgi:tyrosyl-tRNA synthetase
MDSTCLRRYLTGRAETDDLAASQIFYPVMQCADIFFLKADICQLGVDQRKVGGGCTRLLNPVDP